MDRHYRCRVFRVEGGWQAGSLTFPMILFSLTMRKAGFAFSRIKEREVGGRGEKQGGREGGKETERGERERKRENVASS